MANQTTNVGFNVFLENDVVDFDEINYNFEKLDGMALCIESGTKTATYSGGISGNANWYYRKYSDGTVDLFVKMDSESLKCNTGTKIPYVSSAVTVNFPLQLTSILDVQMSVSSETFGWISNITAKNTLDSVKFQIAAPSTETTSVYRQVFINVKGRWK